MTDTLGKGDKEVVTLLQPNLPGIFVGTETVSSKWLRTLDCGFFNSFSISIKVGSINSHESSREPR